MKKINFLMIVIAVIFSSCDDRLETLEALNSAPKVEYYNSNNKLVENITDSVRLMQNALTVYNLRMKLSDANSNVQFLNLIEKKGDYKISYQNNEILAPASFRTDKENLILNLYPTKLGIVSASFKITDRFGLSSTSNVNLFVFDNIPPVAVLIVKKVSGNEYILDASSSYDKDKNFDGKVVKYRFKINGLEYETNNSTLNHLLLPGQNILHLSVMDNSNSFSETVELKVNNN